MSSWGTGVLEDDLAADVYDDYMSLFDSNKDHLSIRQEIEHIYQDCLDDSEDKFSYWFGFARAQWECGILEDDVVQKVISFIDSEESLTQWGTEGEPDYISRKRKLAQFKRTISKAKSKPRKPQKYRFIPACFRPGDCLVFKLSDGRYGAALVLNVNNVDKKQGSTLCGLLDYVSDELPLQEIYENPVWLKLTHHSLNGSVEITWYGAKSIHLAPEGLRVIYHTDKLPPIPTCAVYGGWEGLGQLERQLQWDLEHIAG